jgi:hypothetical protein
MIKRYTDEQVDYVKWLVKDKGIQVTPATRQMCEKFNIMFNDTVGRAFRSKMQKMGVTKNVKVIEDTTTFKKAQKKKFDKRRKKFIITWAQNGTPVHEEFFSNLLAYADFHKAGLHIQAGRYKNPTSVFTDAKHEEWVDDVMPYLDANRHNIHPHLQLLSDVKISPTAATPLSGLNGISDLETCVVGHPRQHLKSLPVLDGYPNKLLVSTGACTIENYTDSKAGAKGVFHHIIGAVMVELDGDDFHIRHIEADNNGNFYDLFYKVCDGEVFDNEDGAEFAVLGDLHLTQEDEEALHTATSLLDIMKPSTTIIHDIFDASTVSHHDRRDPFIMLQKEKEGSLNLEAELQYMYDWLEENKKYNLVITRGNHEDMLDRWLKQTDWRKDYNKFEYFKYGSILAEGKAHKGLVPFLIDEKFQGEVRTLGINDSYRVLDWELALHGHVGSSGSRGSHTQFKSLNTKNVTAHGHHPHKEDGHVSVGTLTKLRLGYNNGLSNWMHGLGLGYSNGKVQLVNIIKGKYTTFK